MSQGIEFQALRARAIEDFKALAVGQRDYFKDFDLAWRIGESITATLTDKEARCVALPVTGFPQATREARWEIAGALAGEIYEAEINDLYPPEELVADIRRAERRAKLEQMVDANPIGDDESLKDYLERVAVVWREMVAA